MIKSNRFKYALSVAAFLATTAAAPVIAANTVGLVGTGDLSQDRASAQLTLSVLCDAAVNAGDNKTGTLTVHIFQPSGRLLTIGIGTAPVTCDGAQADVLVDVNAIPGLKFKPGPATVILKLTDQTTDSTSAVIDSTTTENGSKVTLRP